jgi:DNA recombination-dependent growth factor C
VKSGSSTDWVIKDSMSGATAYRDRLEVRRSLERGSVVGHQLRILTHSDSVHCRISRDQVGYVHVF